MRSPRRPARLISLPLAGMVWLAAVLATGMALAARPAAGAGGGSPEPAGGAGVSVAAPDGGSLQAWLSGPFGRVAGTDSGSLAGPGEAMQVLDTWVRGAPLRLDIGGEGHALAAWRVTSRQQDRPDALEVVLAVSAPTGVDPALVDLRGPDAAGEHLVEAHATAADGRTASARWRLVVPDRVAGPDGLIDVPAPDVVLGNGTDAVAGRPGHGCYVYTCVEAGPLPDARSLPLLEAAAGGPLVVGLSDGSSFVSWSGTLVPLVGGDSVSVAPVTGDPVSEATLTAPPAGEWLVGLEVVFDRERGWFESLFRLVTH